MHTKLLPTLVLGFAIGIVGFVGCGGSSGGTSSSGGSTSSTGGKASGGSTGGSATGGSATGGSANGGAASGGTASGGTASGGKATGGTGTGGTAGSAGSTSAGGSTGNGGSAAGGSTGNGGSAAGGSSGAGIDGGAGNGGAAKPSAGCGKTDGAKTLTTGGSSVASGLPTSTRLKTTSGGHEYIIDIPADYDPTHPYRLIFAWYQAYGSDTGNAIGQTPAFSGPNFDATNYAYYGLHREATAAKEPAIFVAPAGSGNTPWDFTRDSAIFDELLALVDANLCIDDSRVFSTGFSFGAMMTYALSITRQTKLRAVVAMAAANYNLPGEPTDSNAAPIAYMGTTGLSDGTCPYCCVTSDPNCKSCPSVNGLDPSMQGGRGCELTHAKDNGCTIPTTIPTTTANSKKYVCYDFEGCKAGYPVKVCTFDGAHTPASVDDGTNTGDDGLKAFIPPLAWQFISQF